MKIKDYFKLSWILLRRGKKKIVYSLVIFLCCIISFGILIFSDNVNNIWKKSLANNVGFRTILVNYKSIPSGMTKEEQNANDEAELKQIDHVVDVFDLKYQQAVIHESSLANDHLDGAITLNRGVFGSLPTIVAGRTFEENETGVVICPTSFYPTSEVKLVNEEHMLDGRKLLDTSFTIYYYDYLSNKKTGELKENNKYEKTLKIVGLYDVSERFNDNGTCYISTSDLNNIIDANNAHEKQNDLDNTLSEGTSVTVDVDGIYLSVVVDSIDNLDYVNNEIKKLGFEQDGYIATFDKKIVNTIKIIIVIVIVLTLVSVIFIVRSYVKKMINSEEKNIAILRATGYSKKVVHNIYVLQNLMRNLIIYVIGVVVVLITFYVLKNNVPTLIGIDLMIGGIIVTFGSFIFAFVTTVIIPLLVISYNVFRKSDLKIASLIESVE